MRRKVNRKRIIRLILIYKILFFLTRMSELGVSKKRKPYLSTAQKACLVEFLQADEELRGENFSPTFTNKIAAMVH